MEGPQAAPGGLTQEQREQAERNRLAALARRRQSLAQSSTPGPLLSTELCQPPQPSHSSQATQLTGRQQQATPAISSLRNMFIRPSPTPQSRPVSWHPQAGGMGHAQSIGQRCDVGDGVQAPRQLTTHMHNWQPQQHQQLQQHQAEHQSQPAWSVNLSRQGAAAMPQMSGLQNQFKQQQHSHSGPQGPAAAGSARGFRFTEPLRLNQQQQPPLPAQQQQQQQGQHLGQAAMAGSFHPRQPLHPTQQTKGMWGNPPAQPSAFAVSKVYGSNWAQPATSAGCHPPGGEGHGFDWQPQLPHPGQRSNNPPPLPPRHNQQKQHQQGQAQHGRYGSGTTFTFTSSKAQGGAARAPEKQLTQATLGATLSKWRKSKEAAQAQEAAGPSAEALCVPPQPDPREQRQHQRHAQLPASDANPTAVDGLDDLFEGFQDWDSSDWETVQQPPCPQAAYAQAPAQPQLSGASCLQQTQHQAQGQQLQPGCQPCSAWAPTGPSGVSLQPALQSASWPTLQGPAGCFPPQQQGGRAMPGPLTTAPPPPPRPQSKWAAFSTASLPASASGPSGSMGGATPGAAAGRALQAQAASSPLDFASCAPAFGPQPATGTSALGARSAKAALTPPLQAAGLSPAETQAAGMSWVGVRPEGPSPLAAVVGGAGSSNPCLSAAAGITTTPGLSLPALRRPESQAKAKLKAKAQRILGRSTAEEEAEDRERWGWLKERKDAQGRSSGDPDFNHATILIPPSEQPRRPFDRQYWSIKKGHMDLVLFVRVGSFYELYDQDADIGMRVGLNPMAGQQPANMWKVGTSEKSFAEWAAKVLALGYNVGRVEEYPGKNADKLVNRRLAQVYTPGTVLDGPMLEGVGGSQPLIALYEGWNNSLGACVVDVSLSTISLSQWQEVDASRSMLATLLLQANPAEVVVMRGGRLAPDTLKLLRRHKPLSADGMDRMLTISQLHDYTLLQDPDDPGSIPDLVAHTGDIFSNQGGQAGAWRPLPEYLATSAPYAAVALQMALHHLQAAGVAQKVVKHVSFRPIAAFTSDGARMSGHMLLDSNAIKTLELVEDSLGTLEGSLLRFLDQADNAAGRRRVRAWLCSPLYRVGDIAERLDMVEAFMRCPDTTGGFGSALRGTPDCERLLPKVADKLAVVLERAVTAVDAQEDTLEQQHFQHDANAALPGSAGGAAAAQRSKWVPGTADGQGDSGLQLFEQAASTTDLRQAAFLPVVQLFEGLGMLLQALQGLEQGLAAERGTADGLPPMARALARGRAVATHLATLLTVFDARHFSEPEADIALEPGVSPEYDAVNARVEALRQALEEAVAEQQQKLTGCGEPAALTKKVRLVQQGEEMLLEVPVAAGKHMRGCVLVKETKTVGRYRAPAIAEVLGQLEQARAEAKAVVLDSMAEAAKLFLDEYQCFQEFVGCMAALDALAGFAVATHPEAAPAGCSFCRPVFAAAASQGAVGPTSPLHLEGLWSPQLLFSNVGHIEPNTLRLGGSAGSASMLLTGANTGGKSTLLRASCLAVIMAQLGCYVPCSRAELAPVDRIFTRIGAQDRIMSGESTFLVEMTETSSLLQQAQPASLVVLDELGRGTSTFDGYAIAYAVLMQLSQANRCRSLFATHYHGLNHEPDLQPIVRQAHMATAVQPEGLVPLFQLREGPAPEGSCGIEVAAACGMPPSLIERAMQRAGHIEQEILQRQGAKRKRQSQLGDGNPALTCAENNSSTSSSQASVAAQQVLAALARDQEGEPAALQAAVQQVLQLREVLLQPVDMLCI